MTKPIAPTIERLKFKELHIDEVYSGRSKKEITENAKEKQKELEAAGGWNPAMPGQYFETADGKKCLLAGFSRVQASILNGETEGYFVRVDGDVVDHLLACETTNSVVPLSPLSRGARYFSLREGKLSEDFKEAIADPKNPAHWERMPMSSAQIAERIGKTPVWITKCIAIFEAPPEVRDLLESDKIATTVAEGARALVNKHHNGSDAKMLAICKRAFAFARAEEADTATKKHFDAIKAEFIPEKKLVADTKDEKDKTQEGGKDGASKPAKASESKSKGDTAEDEDKGDGEQLPADNEAEQLFKEQTAEVLKEGSKKNKLLQEALKTFLTDDAALEKIDVSMTLNPDEAERLAEALLSIVHNAATVF